MKYSKICDIENITPTIIIIVLNFVWNNLFFNVKLQHRVIVNREEINTVGFNNGTSYEFKGIIFLGGHTFPISRLGEVDLSIY